MENQKGLRIIPESRTRRQNRATREIVRYRRVRKGKLRESQINCWLLFLEVGALYFGKKRKKVRFWQNLLQMKEICNL